jgi:hypothetical protein
MGRDSCGYTTSLVTNKHLTSGQRFTAETTHNPKLNCQKRRSLVFFFGGTLNGASINASNWASSGCFDSFNRCR